jgi:hypothetical protein
VSETLVGDSVAESGVDAVAEQGELDPDLAALIDCAGGSLEPCSDARYALADLHVRMDERQLLAGAQA